VLNNLQLANNKRLVTAALVEAINAEGPIHVDRLARSVAAAFEVRKVSPARVTDMAALIPKSVVRSENGSVAWPARQQPETWTGFRSSDNNEPRPSEHLPLREIGNAMVSIVTANGPTAPLELLGITRRIFGGKRLTPASE
jgi:hypothetical protein